MGWGPGRKLSRKWHKYILKKSRLSEVQTIYALFFAHINLMCSSAKQTLPATRTDWNWNSSNRKPYWYGHCIYPRLRFWLVSPPCAWFVARRQYSGARGSPGRTTKISDSKLWFNRNARNVRAGHSCGAVNKSKTIRKKRTSNYFYPRVH